MAAQKSYFPCGAAVTGQSGGMAAAGKEREQARGLAWNPIPKGGSLAMVRTVTARSDYRLHAHGCFEMIYIADGHGRCFVGDHRGAFGPGELVLVGPGLPHCWHSDGFLPDGKRLDIRVFWFDAALAGEAARVLPELSGLSGLFARAGRGVRFLRGTALDLHRQLAELAESAGAGALGRLLVVLERLGAAKEARQLSGRALARGPAEEPGLERLGRVVGFLEERFRDGLTLPGAARELGMSVSTMNGLLKRHHGLTFLEYVARLRVEAAARALRFTRGEITAIAFETGFRSLATFNRRFRRAFGTSPHEYREGHR